MALVSYRTYLLILLLVIQAFVGVDRLALGLLFQAIKADLVLTDTQLGFLTGIAFALFYAVLGIPLARLSDLGNRAAIITITTALWGGMVILCGLATSFAQLLLIRIGVAVGEAGCLPPAHSLIADYFDRSERPRAMAIYHLSGPIGVVISFFLVGWLNELFGWRTTIMVLGVPGVLLAIVAWLTLREPRLSARMTTIQGAVPHNAKDEQPGLTEVFRTLWSIVTFRHVLLFFAIASLFGSGLWQWKPAFFMRSYGMQSGEVGTWFAAIYAIGGLVGVYLGGELASRYAANNERLQLKAMAIVYIGFGALSALMYVTTHRWVAFGLMTVATVTTYATYGPLFATIQTLVPERMRAMSIAVLHLLANLVGIGLGPLAVGAISDSLRPRLGDESLRYALILFAPGYFWASWHLWRSSRSITRDLERVQVGVHRLGAAK
jgi:MFS family permease